MTKERNMNHLVIATRTLTALAAAALLATALPAFAGTDELRADASAATADKATMSHESGAKETCNAAKRQEECKTPWAFPPLDMAASLFSAMGACSRNGI